jgi:hypothetical protein
LGKQPQTIGGLGKRGKLNTPSRIRTYNLRFRRSIHALLRVTPNSYKLLNLLKS